MSRKEFLKVLRKRLSFLSKEELETEILYYINEIDKSKEADADIIKGFGSIDTIVKKTAKKYNREYKEKTMVEKTSEFYKDLENLGLYIKKSENKERGKIIMDLLILIFVTILLKLPFILVRNLGDNLINIAFNSNITLLAIWGLIIELLYVVGALYFFAITFRRWLKTINIK